MDFTAQQCRSSPDGSRDIAPSMAKEAPSGGRDRACCGQKLMSPPPDSATGEPGDNEQRRSDGDSRNVIAQSFPRKTVQKAATGG